jgi:L-threonylcarbamoyladenylate synthase
MEIDTLKNSSELGSELGNELGKALYASREGKLVAVVTDTVWGLVADPHNPVALERLYHSKKRPLEKPLQCLCANLEVVKNLCDLSDPRAKNAFERLHTFWPGGLTLLLPARSSVPEPLRPAEMVGVRIPNHPITLELLRGMGGYAACSSLNLSGEPAIILEEVALEHPELYDFLLPGGDAAGVASTVYDPINQHIVRQGAITLEELDAALQRELLE